MECAFQAGDDDSLIVPLHDQLELRGATVGHPCRCYLESRSTSDHAVSIRVQ